jgi:hypothetical protein
VDVRKPDFATHYLCLLRGFGSNQENQMNSRSIHWRRLRGLALAGILGASSASAMATNYECGGPVNGVTVDHNGVVVAESAGGQHYGYFCQLGTTSNNVSSDACKGILAVLLTAQSTDKQINIWYNDANDCAWHASNGSWAWLSTWYFGPMVAN